MIFAVPIVPMGLKILGIPKEFKVSHSEVINGIDSTDLVSAHRKGLLIATHILGSFLCATHTHAPEVNLRCRSSYTFTLFFV